MNSIAIVNARNVSVVRIHNVTFQKRQPFSRWPYAGSPGTIGPYNSTKAPGRLDVLSEAVSTWHKEV